MSKLSVALKDVSDGEKYCPYAVLRGKLSQDDTVALDAAIAKGTPSYVIAKILRAEGYRCSHGGIQDHRDATCICPKEKK